MTFLTSGRPDVSATSRAAKTDATSSPRPCTAGSGRRIARRWHPPIKRRTVGASIRGRKRAIRRSSSRTMPSMTSTAPTNPACPSWTMFTTTASPGTTSRVTTRNRSSARTLRSCSTTWPAPTAVFVSNAIAVSWHLHGDHAIVHQRHISTHFSSILPVAESTRHVPNRDARFSRGDSFRIFFSLIVLNVTKRNFVSVK